MIMVSYAQAFFALSIMAAIAIAKINGLSIPGMSRTITKPDVEYFEAIHDLDGSPCPLCDVGHLVRSVVNYGQKNFSVTMSCIDGCGEPSYWELEGDAWTLKAPYNLKHVHIPTVALTKAAEKQPNPQTTPKDTPDLELLDFEIELENEPENVIECIVCHHLVDATLENCPICEVSLDLSRILGGS